MSRKLLLTSSIRKSAREERGDTELEKEEKERKEKEEEREEKEKKEEKEEKEKKEKKEKKGKKHDSRRFHEEADKHRDID